MRVAVLSVAFAWGSLWASASQELDHLRSAQQEITKLYETIFSVLDAPLHVSSVQKEIQEVYERLKKEKQYGLPDSFCTECADLKFGSFQSPEDLFPEEQFKNLIAGPAPKKSNDSFGSYAQNLEPLTQEIAKLHQFTVKWRALADYARQLEYALDQILLTQKEEEMYAEKLCKGLLADNQTTVDKNILLEIYGKIKSLHQIEGIFRSHALAYKDALEKVKTGIPEEIDKRLDAAWKVIYESSCRRGNVLWQVLIRHIDLVGLPENYEEIQVGYFSDADTPLSKLMKTFQSPSLSECNNTASSSSSSSLSSARKNFPDDQIKSALRQTLTNTFAYNLVESKSINEAKREIRAIANTRYVVASAEKLKAIYVDFGTKYKSNLKDAGNMLRPWGNIRFKDYPIRRLTQGVLRDIFDLDSNGPLCFGQDRDSANKNELIKIIGKDQKLELRIGKYVSPNVGLEIAQYLLEKLFHLPTSPLVLLTVDHLSCLVPEGPATPRGVTPPPRSKQQKELSKSLEQMGDVQAVKEAYLNNPGDWSEKPIQNFAIVQPYFEGKTLEDFLKDVAEGRECFGRLDFHSFGVPFLFSLLTNSWVLPETLGIEQGENGQVKYLKRMGQQSFLQPFFESIPIYEKDTKDQAQRSKRNVSLTLSVTGKKHKIVGINVLMLLPLLNQKIPDSVKKEFAKNNIGFHLSLWLRELDSYQHYFDQLIPLYPSLTQPRDVIPGEPDQKKIVKMCDVLGLKIRVRPKTIERLVKNFETISEALKEQDVTYADIFKELRFHEYTVYHHLIQKAQEETETDIQKWKTLFQIFIPAHLKNIREGGLSFNKGPLYAEQDLGYTLQDLIAFEKGRKECLSELEKQKQVTVESVLGSLDEKHRTFFQSKYQQAQAKNVFYIDTLNKVIQILQEGNDDLTVCEKLGLNLSNWDAVDQTDGANHNVVTARIVESTCSVHQMIHDLANNIVLSSHPIDEAIKIMETLLPLLPDKKKLLREVSTPRSSGGSSSSRSNEAFQPYHPSWVNLVDKENTTFLALPFRVKEFLEKQGWGPEVQRRVLEQAQLQMAKTYKNEMNYEKGKYLSDKEAGYWLRRLFFGGKNFSPEEQKLFHGIVDLLVFPVYESSQQSDLVAHDSGSLGVSTSHPEGAEGYLRLNKSVGDHYLDTLAERRVWNELLQSNPILTAEMRRLFLSHCAPLLLLKWLAALKQSCSTISFHPWFVRLLPQHINRLQEILSQRWDLSFSDVMVALCPEIYYYYTHQKRLQGQQIKPSKLDKTQMRENQQKLTPIEHHADLGWIPEGHNGKNLQNLLRAQDDQRILDASQKPYSLGDFAVEVFSQVHPSSYGIDVLMLILQTLAEKFPDAETTSIDVERWQKFDYRKNFLSKPNLTPLVLSQALSVRLGGEVIVNEGRDTLTIRNTVTTEPRHICEVIPWFTSLKTLSFENNGLRYLASFASCLQRLSSLENLFFKEEPLHDPMPLVTLTQLKRLSFSGTYIPSTVSNKEIPVFQVFKPSAKSPNQFKDLQITAQASRVGRIGVLTTHTLITDTVSKVKKLGSLRKEDEIKLVDDILVYWEYAAENRWHEALEPDAIERIGAKKSDFPYQDFWNLFSEYSARKTAALLLYALQMGLPQYTDRDKLVLIEDAYPYQPISLNHLAIIIPQDKNPEIKPDFLQNLALFSNLQRLSLINVGLTGLDGFPRMSSLQVLDVRNNQITSLRGLRVASSTNLKFPGLNVLNLNNNRLTSENLACLEFLIQQNNLRRLEMNNNNLTVVPLLGNLQCLVYLDITNNKISQDQIKKYKNVGENGKKFLYTPQKGGE